MTNSNIHADFELFVSREEQERLLNQKGLVIWFTGLSGSGKSTIASSFEKELYNNGFFVKVLDGDNIRSGINNNLGFSMEDRQENIRRISEVAKLFVDSGVIVLCSFVSPTREIRQTAKDIIGEKDFYEVFVNTPIEVCESRDVKGLYKKARKGEIKGFTGIDSPYEEPINATLVLDTTQSTVAQSVQQLNELLNKENISK